MDRLFNAVRALALLSVANSVPVIVAQFAKDRWAVPLDFGWVLWDGERLFGNHKTWRGLVSGVAACTGVAILFDLTFLVGVGFACASLMADSISSAAKRRMHLQPGTERVGLDQIGEALLPLMLFADSLSLGWGMIAGVTAAFTVLDIAAANLRHRRWRP